MWRAYIAQHKYRVVLDGITDSSSTASGLKAIRKVAEYFNSIGEPFFLLRSIDGLSEKMVIFIFISLFIQVQRTNVMQL